VGSKVPRSRRPGPYRLWGNARKSRKDLNVAIETELLKGERENLRGTLRDTEAQVRKVEAELKALRQREIQTKREIEALSTLIEIKEHRDVKPEAKPESGTAT
jgi:hypothetical protein